MGLIVSVYRSAERTIDCTNSGQSIKHSAFTLLNARGAFDPAPHRPAAMLRKNPTTGCHIEMVGDENAHTMFGGNFAYCCDSSLARAVKELSGDSLIGAIPIHDRIETALDQYQGGREDSRPHVVSSFAAIEPYLDRRHEKIKDMWECRRIQLRGMKPEHKFHYLDSERHIEQVYRESQSMMAGYQPAKHAVEFHAPMFSTDKFFRDLQTATLAHDLGKVDTWNPEGGEKGYFRGHEKVSALLCEEAGFKYDDPVTTVVREHGSLKDWANMKDKTKMKLIRRICAADHEMILALFICLLDCDAAGFSDEGRKIAHERRQDFWEYCLCINYLDFELPNNKCADFKMIKTGCKHMLRSLGREVVR